MEQIRAASQRVKEMIVGLSQSISRQVSRAVENVNEVTQGAASAAEEMSRVTELLAGMAQELQKLTAQFKIQESEADASSSQGGELDPARGLPDDEGGFDNFLDSHGLLGGVSQGHERTNRLGPEQKLVDANAGQSRAGE